MKKIFIGLLIASTLISWTNPPRGPRVFALDASVLNSNKAKIQAKDPELMGAYKQVIKEADKALLREPHSVMEKKNNPPSGDKHDFMSLAPYFWPDPSKPDGLPYMRKDGQTNPEVKEYLDKEYLPNMCADVISLATAYFYSDDEKYAAHAAKLLQVWFLDTATRMNPNLNYAQAIKGSNDGRGAGMIDTRHFIKLVDAVGMLGSSKYWRKQDQQGLQSWFSAFLNWMQTSPNGLWELKAKNNHGTWYDAQRMALALYVDSNALAKKIIDNAKGRLDSQMDEEGKFPLEMERTIALHYNLFDLEAFYWLAQMGEQVGENLWKYSSLKGKSLKKGFDFLYPYISDKKPWTGQQIKPFPFSESYPVLLISSRKYNCAACKDDFRRLAGDKATRLPELLLY